MLFLGSSRPEEKIKILEKKVNDLIEESCMAQSIGALQLVRLCHPLTYCVVIMAVFIWREGSPSEEVKHYLPGVVHVGRCMSPYCM